MNFWSFRCTSGGSSVKFYAYGDVNEAWNARGVIFLKSQIKG